MILTVIGASILGCMGFKLERLLGFLRMALGATLITLTALAYIFYRQMFSEMLSSSTGSTEMLILLVKTELTWTILGLLFVVTTTFFLQLKFPRLGNALSTFILFAFATAAISVVSKLNLPQAVVLAFMAVSALVAVTLRLWQRELYSIWTTAVVGGVLVAFLFTKFYYLPIWLFILLAILFSSLGFLIQHSSWKKSEQTGDVK